MALDAAHSLWMSSADPALPSAGHRSVYPPMPAALAWLQLRAPTSCRPDCQTSLPVIPENRAPCPTRAPHPSPQAHSSSCPVNLGAQHHHRACRPPRSLGCPRCSLLTLPSRPLFGSSSFHDSVFFSSNSPIHTLTCNGLECCSSQMVALTPMLCWLPRAP